MSEVLLPSGWVLTQLGTLGRWSSGGTPSRGQLEYYGGDIPWVKTGELRDCRIAVTDENITEEGLANSSAKVFPKGTLLVAMYGATIGQLGILDMPAATNQACAALLAEGNTTPLIPYIYYFIRGQRETLKAAGQGGAQPNISQGFLKDYPTPLAPLPEQHRIVDALDSYFTRLDAAITTLERVQRNLKRYRASVLKSAVEGRLVPTEAALARAEGRDYEPASKLLARILKRRGMAIDVGAIREPEPLPEGWSWSAPDTLAVPDAGAICAGPFGTIFKAHDFRPEGIPIIFLRHVKPGRYLTSKPGFMDHAKWNELFKPYSVFGGELLVTKLGDPPGECAIYPEGIGPAMVTPDVMKMSVDSTVVEPQYLMHYLNSEQARKVAFGVAFGTTRLRMTLTLFRTLPVPIPPIAEQRRIIAEIDRLFSLANESETLVETNLKRAHRLRQSILKWAFEGKLADQDPNDEPASVLLERIIAERTRTEQAKPARKPGRPAKRS